MTKDEIRNWLRLNRGASKKLVAILGLSGPSSLSMWLSNKSPSRPLDKAVPVAVRKMIAKQQKEAKHV